VVKLLHKKYRAKGKKIYFDLGAFTKGIYWVPREMICWAIHKLVFMNGWYWL